MNKEYDINRLTPRGRISRIAVDVTVYISPYNCNTTFPTESIMTSGAFFSSFF